MGKDRHLFLLEQQRLEKVYESAIPDGATAATGAEYERLAANLCERWGIDPNEKRSMGIAGGACHVG